METIEKEDDIDIDEDELEELEEENQKDESARNKKISSSAFCSNPRACGCNIYWDTWFYDGEPLLVVRGVQCGKRCSPFFFPCACGELFIDFDAKEEHQKKCARFLSSQELREKEREKISALEYMKKTGITKRKKSAAH